MNEQSLRRVLRHLGITMVDAAELIGVSRTTLYRWSREESDTETTEELRKKIEAWIGANTPNPAQAASLDRISSELATLIGDSRQRAAILELIEAML